MTERQLARPLWGIFPLGARAELWNRANGKRAIFRVFCREMSSGQWKLIFRGMQWKYFQVLSLLTGHRMIPPMCGMGNGRDGEKLLCNRCPLKHEARERERGEMLYENMSTENIAFGKPVERSTTYVSDTWNICVVWVQPSITVYNNLDPRHGRIHPMKIDK